MRAVYRERSGGAEGRNRKNRLCSLNYALLQGRMFA
jgi:hypothetical protein